MSIARFVPTFPAGLLWLLVPFLSAVSASEQERIGEPEQGTRLQAMIAALDPGPYPRFTKEDPVGAYPLHTAALNDDVGAALRLIDGGIPVDAGDVQGRTPLMVAAAFGNINVAKALLDRGANPRSRDKAHGDTPLHFAALAGRVEVAKLLLAREDANVGANLGETPLHYAALYNHLKMIVFLVENGAKIDAVDGMGLTPLQYARRQGRQQATILLSELGARPDTLLGAVNAGDLIRVRELLRGGADPNEADMSGTALHLAAALGHVAIAAALVDAGADIEAEGEPARAHPLHTAALRDHPDIALFLIDRGAQVEARDAEGRTPLIVAALFGGSARLGEILLSRGADPIALDRTWSDTVLHYAAISGNVALAGALLAHGVDINARNRRTGAAPMHYAAGMGKPAMIEFLVANGADLSPVDKTGQTPYQLADKHRNLGVMGLLVSLGAPQ